MLSSRPGIEVVAEAENGEQAVQRTRQFRPDVVLLDIQMPGSDSIDAVRTIKQEMPKTKVIVLGASDHEDDLLMAVKNGADGYLQKDVDPSQFFALLEGIQTGIAPISNAAAEKILRELRKLDALVQHAGERPDTLTPKEIETLELVVRGDSNREIADILHISESTVKLHLRNIMQKLHLQNRTQLAAYAVDQGLVHTHSD